MVVHGGSGSGAINVVVRMMVVAENDVGGGSGVSSGRRWQVVSGGGW